MSPDRSVPASLPEVHASVGGTTAPTLWRRLFAFAGPAYMVSVGYMDPGNWATDLEGGSRFGYQLLWVLAMSNLMAVLLQTLTARLGIVTGRDLAQACRENYSRPVALALWVLCEIAIAATDLAEVLGTAIGLNLLFGMPLVMGVVVTALDVFILLAIQRLGMRKMEGFILALVTTIGACFVVEVLLSRPVWGEVVTGFIPRLAGMDALYVAIGILGATVMPHNLYLHSALVQTRQIVRSEEGMRQACRYNLIDSAVALNCAFFVNASILILAAAVFHSRGIEVTEIQQAHELLAPLLGTGLASVLFALALLCAGQSSTVTGTLAGQVVMEGFIRFQMRPWLRRLVTRSVAIVPAVITISILGDEGTYRLLILSQVILSLQLPFAVIPLLHFTGDREKMGVFANGPIVRVMAWTVAAVILGLNTWLVWGTITGWVESSSRPLLTTLLVLPLSVGITLLLAYVILEPWFRRWRRVREAAVAPAAPPTPAPAPVAESGPTYRRIAIALAAEPFDRRILEHGLSMARASRAQALLVHVAQGFGPRFFGTHSEDEEIREDRAYLEAIRLEAERMGVAATVHLLYGSPVEQLYAFVEQEHPDLLVVGSHGHRALGDLFFGSTVEPLRHRIRIPILIVR